MKLPNEMNHDKLHCRETKCCIPSQRRFTCPLTNKIMEDPVSAPCCGANFERKAVLRWMRKNGYRCPESGDSLLPSDLTAHSKLQWEILYLERKNSSVVEGSVSDTTPSRPIPPPPADTPPSMPRSHCSSLNTRKTLQNSNERRSSLNESNHSRADLPPTLPRSPSSLSSQSSTPFKRIDSAPSIPRRSTPNMYDFLLSQSLTSSHNEAFPAFSSPSKSDNLINLLDDVLAVLSDNEP